MSEAGTAKKSRFQQFVDRYDDLPKPLRKGKYLFIFCMLFLSIMSFLVFYVYVNFSSIIMAFQKPKGWDANNQQIVEWGFANFRDFFEDMTKKSYVSEDFKAALRNTIFLFFLGNAFVIPIQYMISYFIYKKIVGYKVFRVLLYLPHILSTVVMVTIYRNIIEVHGLLSGIVTFFGGKPIDFMLTTNQWAKWSVLFYNNWMGFAGSYIILTAAMQRIPIEVVESAKLDGITPLVEFWKIVIPMIWPTVYILILEKITGLLSADGPILLLTDGAYDTYTIGFWYYKQVIVNYNFNYPSAVGLILTCFIAPIGIIARKLLDKVYADVEY